MKVGFIKGPLCQTAIMTNKLAAECVYILKFTIDTTIEDK